LEMMHGPSVFRKICSKKVIVRSENGRDVKAEVLARLGSAGRPKRREDEQGARREMTMHVKACGVARDWCVWGNLGGGQTRERNVGG